MAESKTTKTTKKRTSWGLNKISFYVIGAMAILYLIASILSLCGISSVVIQALQGLATAASICIVGYRAWFYVKNAPTVWKVLYAVCLVVVLIGIVIPMI